MARRTFSDVIESWQSNHGGGYGMNEYAVQNLLNELDRAGFAIVRTVTPEDLVGDDG